MKKLATVLVGFIAGLAISGVLGDLIVAVHNSAGRISAARSISRAEKDYAGGNFSEGLIEYEKALGKIKPDNKILLAKVKNDMGLGEFNLAAENKDAARMEKSILLFKDALALYKETGNAELAAQTQTNLNTAQKTLKKLKRK